MDVHVPENPAARLHRFVSKMLQQPHNFPLKRVLLHAAGEEWGNLNSRQQTVQTLRIVDLMLREQELLVSALKAMHKTEKSYAAVVGAIEARLTLDGIQQAWSEHKGAFERAEQQLATVSEWLPDDTPHLDDGDIKKLKEDVLKLREKVSKSNHSAFVKSFVLHQLDLILRAIEDYPIAGAKVFHTAMWESTEYEADHIEEVSKHENEADVKVLRQIQTAATKYGKVAISSAAFLKACEVLAGYGVSLYLQAPDVANKVVHMLGAGS